MTVLAGARNKSSRRGAPVWMVTFADLMALLLAFFVLLFTFSELDKQLYKQIAGSMRDALGVQTKKRVKEPPKGVSLIAREFSPGKPQPTPVDQMRQSRADDTKSKVLMPDAGNDPEAESSEDRMQAEAERIKASLAEEIEAGSVEVEVSDQRIIVRILEQDAFPSGSDQPMLQLDNVLHKMGTVLRSTGGAVIVSGHTDNVPIRNERFRSNWELSAARAVSVVHALMVETGLDSSRFMVEGAAETKPIDSNDTPHGRARNRRVEVTLVYAEDRELDKAEVDRKQSAAEASAGAPPVDAPADEAAMSDTPAGGTPLLEALFGKPQPVDRPADATSIDEPSPADTLSDEVALVETQSFATPPDEAPAAEPEE